MEFRLAELAERLGGELGGDPDIQIRGVGGIKEAQPGEITFLGNPRYEEWLSKTEASAVILPREHPFNGRACIRVTDPYEAFRAAMELFRPERSLISPGTHPSALLGGDVRLGTEVAIGPNVIIGDRTSIGDRTVIHPGVVIGPDVTVGSHCLVYPNVVIREDVEIGSRLIIHAGAVIGDDGFGFVTKGQAHEKMPQLGRVVIEDDVDIGANTCIDRATTGATVIRQGSRIDNLVQVAHNVTVGLNSIICAQVGIAGSTHVGDRVTLAGQVGIVGHIEIGDDAMVGAQGGVTKTVPAGTQVSGYPAAPHRLAKRMYAALRQLPELLKEFGRLKKRVDEMEEKGGEGR
jgi:UDP-3-O-[3-hydroxymyristoyl] glucosamine N-acyltransferase